MRTLLLEELFRLCCRYAGQTPTIQTPAREAQRVLQADVGAQRMNAYLRFLGDTLLLRPIPLLAIRLKRKRSSPKLSVSAKVHAPLSLPFPRAGESEAGEKHALRAPHHAGRFTGVVDPRLVALPLSSLMLLR